MSATEIEAVALVRESHADLRAGRVTAEDVRALHADLRNTFGERRWDVIRVRATH